MTSTPFQKKVLSAVAVGLTVFSLVAGLSTSRWFEVAELKALDHLVRRYADPAKADSNLVLLAIDESSLEAFGRWPWPRDRFGYVVRYLKQAGARAVVFDVMFFEADENAEEFDQSFADDLKAAGNVFLPMLFQAEPAAIRTPIAANESLTSVDMCLAPFDERPIHLEGAGSIYVSRRQHACSSGQRAAVCSEWSRRVPS